VGLLPTVKTTDHHKQRTLNEHGENVSHTTGTKYGLHLTQLAESGMLPTPTTQRIAGLLLTPTTREEVMDMNKFKTRMEKYNNGTTVPNLATQIHGMLPTPTSSCQNAGTEIERTDGVSRRSELNHLMSQEAGKSSQLSPLFVEEMMGFPKNWTALPFQSGEENPSKHTEML